MQSDPLIWKIIGRNFCSFKVILREQKVKFCRNEYNVSGMCDKLSCPLANSRYATVREENGIIYLYVKTIERAHSPKNLWEKIELNFRYTTALGQIDEELEHWPALSVHKVKQRLTKLHQYLLRMKKIVKNPVKYSHMNKKEHRRDMAREVKALSAAKLDFAIKKELLDRLKNKVYGDLYNINPQVFNEVMDEQGEDEQPNTEFVELDDEEDAELMKETEEEDMEDIDAAGLNEQEASDDDDDDDDLGLDLSGSGGDTGFGDDDVADTGDAARDLKTLQGMLLTKLGQDLKRKGKKTPARATNKKPRKEGAHIEIEYETDPATSSTTR